MILNEWMSEIYYMDKRLWTFKTQYSTMNCSKCWKTCENSNIVKYYYNLKSLLYLNMFNMLYLFMLFYL